MWAAFAGAGAAHAQLSGSATFVSDYRFRGASLSDERPAVQAAMAYDTRSGWYAGLFASTVRLSSDRRIGVQGLGHVGYALRGAGGLSWDLGVAYTGFSEPGDRDYTDYYAGAAGSDWSTRVSYAPRYFGQPYAALYAELNLLPGSEHELVPVLHVGWLSLHPPPYGPRSRWDGRFGLAFSRASLTLQLSWVITSRATGTADQPRKAGWVLRATQWL